jgi:hypothetical protein
LAEEWKEEPSVLSWLKNCAESDDCGSSQKNRMRQAAVMAIGQVYKDNLEIFIWLKKLAQVLQPVCVRYPAIEMLATIWSNEEETLDILLLNAVFSNKPEDWVVREEALTQLGQVWNQKDELFIFLCERAVKDPFIRIYEFDINPRLRAIQILIEHYSTYPQTVELLRDRATNDPDEKLREWAQEQLKMHDVKVKMEASSNG